MSDNSSTHSSSCAPPMSAFQGLSLSKPTSNRNKSNRRSSLGSSSPKPTFNPIDPIETLGLQDDDDCHSEITIEETDDEEASPPNSPSLFENLDRNWSFGEAGEWERSCFAAFCYIFFIMDEYKLPTPNRAIVDGLWSVVVLPKLVEKSTKISQLVSQDIWTLLKTKLQYLTEDEDNGGVQLAHDVYRDYGKKLILAQNNDTCSLKHDFGVYLQDALLNGRQPQVVKLYAVKCVVPYFLALNYIKQAASLLHQPCFSSQEWKLLRVTENPLEITMRHVCLVEEYLMKLSAGAKDNTLVDSKWQEALGLYQGWHSMLQQEIEILPIDYQSSMGSLSGDENSSKASGGSSSARKNARRNRRLLSQPQVDPLQLLIFGRSLYVLSQSLDSILTQEPQHSPAMSLLWRRQAEYVTQSLTIWSLVNGGTEIMQIQHLLGAASWMSLSVISATLEETDIVVDVDQLARLYRLPQVDEDESDEIKCLQAAKALVEHTVAPKSSNKTLQLLYLSVSAELLDTFGRWIYDKQQYSEARQPLEEATKVRRQILTLLKDTQQQDPTALFWWDTRPQALAQEDAEDTEPLCRQLCLQPPNLEKTVKEMELSLALSLEYAALALHACNLSMAALSWLQEALILKTTHDGKSSLEVARLNAAMAVVYEDMLSWDTALSSYRECLRIRMQVLSQVEPDEWFVSQRDLFRSILDSLRSMGNAYRMLGDHDNAVGCYWKIATLSRKQWEFLNRTSAKVSFWGFDGHRQMGADLREMPLPRLILDEERYMKLSNDKDSNHHSMAASNGQRQQIISHDHEHTILFEGAQAYQTILSLFQDKACAGAGRKGMQTSNYDLAQFVALDDLPIMLAASYRLGLIHIHFCDYRSAISSMERALHSLWALDPNSSDSGSSSEDSSGDEEESGYTRKAQKRKRALRGIFGKEMEAVDDEAVYHALGICRAACGEHDQAVRFLLTALRCARRMFGVNSTRASEILYDVATSYWHLKDFDKAREFWVTCLQIRDSGSTKNMNDSWMASNAGDNFVDGFTGERIEAMIQYNLSASLCSMGRYSDSSVLGNLENAKTIFADRVAGQSNVEVANCLFYMAVATFRQASKYDVDALQKANGFLNLASNTYRAIGLIPSSASTSLEESKLLSHNVELQAHLRLVEANILETLGKLNLALDIYTMTLHLYSLLEEKRWTVYVASVLNTMGKMHVKMDQDSAALANFEKALELRRNCLGRDHEVVGDTLYQMAEIYGRLYEFDIAMEMYHETVRIQIGSEGRDSPSVALTLLKIASLYAQQGQYEMAMEKLNGSLTIRKQRFSRVGKASQAVSFMSGDLADDYLVLSKQETKKDACDDHLIKILQDDMVKEEVGLAIVLHCMGNVHVQLCDRKAAKECFEESLRVRTRHPVAEVMSLDNSIKLHAADTLHNLGCLYEVDEDFDSALKYYATALRLKHPMLHVQTELSTAAPQQALVIYEGKDSLDGRYLQTSGSSSYALTLHRLGTVHYRLDNQKVSLACLDAALRIQKQKLGVHHYLVANTLADMGSTLRRMDGKHDRARKCYMEACEIRKLRNRSDADVGHVFFQVGKLYDSENDYTRAVVYYHRAIQTYGRRYVNAVGRRFCEAFLFNNLNNCTTDEKDSKNILGNDFIKVRSIEETDDMITSHFTAVSEAIRGASRKRAGQLGQEAVMMSLDVNAPDCLISLELYLLSMFELMTHMSVEMKKHAHVGIQHVVRQLEQAGSESFMGPDPMFYKMHYLIQE